MAVRRMSINPFHSLRTQLCAGAVLLLGITVASISYFLIDYEKTILRDEIQKAVVLQGRNIALGSEKALLRSDPEFELFPLVKTLLETTPSIESVVITDAAGVIYGHSELQNVSRKYEADLRGYRPASSSLLSVKEELRENAGVFALKTPVTSLDRTIGYVHLSYSKDEFNQFDPARDLDHARPRRPRPRPRHGPFAHPLPEDLRAHGTAHGRRAEARRRRLQDEDQARHAQRVSHAG